MRVWAEGIAMENGNEAVRIRGRRKKQKPVRNADGELVTPVSGEPAANINWAPACPACQSRTCGDCDSEQPHALTKCRKCGGTNLSEKHRCPETRSRGTVESSIGTRQKCKCLVCGNCWAWTVKPPPE